VKDPAKPSSSVHGETDCLRVCGGILWSVAVTVVAVVSVDEPDIAFSGSVKATDGGSLVTEQTVCVLCYQAGRQH